MPALRADVYKRQEAKRLWLQQRLKEGHTFRKLNKKATVFIEYAPLASAWVPDVYKRQQIAGKTS